MTSRDSSLLNGEELEKEGFWVLTECYCNKNQKLWWLVCPKVTESFCFDSNCPIRIRLNNRTAGFWSDSFNLNRDVILPQGYDSDSTLSTLIGFVRFARDLIWFCTTSSRSKSKSTGSLVLLSHLIVIREFKFRYYAMRTHKFSYGSFLSSFLPKFLFLPFSKKNK